ncbi:Nuclease-related domain protein [compost metagenome]
MLQQYVHYIQKSWINLQIRKHKLQFNRKIATALKLSTDTLKKHHHRYKFIINQFADAVDHSSRQELQSLKRKKNVIDEINTFIYGAIGEQKVANELAALPDNFVLINDFQCSFKPPIYNRKENDYIKSVQIDHLLVSPAGIFLIETKNWSADSLKNHNLHSPVAQIRRASFALYKVLNTNIAKVISIHHWGARKVPIKNLIVFTNQQPNDTFQYVKILGLKELCPYLSYFKPIFSNEEVQMIAKYLLRLSK